MQLQLRGRRDRLGQQIFEIGQFRPGVALEQRQQQAVLVAEVIFDQRGIGAGFLRDVAQRDLDRRAFDHQLARGNEQFLCRGILSTGEPVRYAGRHGDSCSGRMKRAADKPKQRLITRVN